MSAYTIKRAFPSVWEIDDGRDSTLYIIEGTDRALVIDTGMSEDNVIEMIESLTDKPYDLALTHGHGDHSLYCADFHRVYLDMADKFLLFEGKFEGQVEPPEENLIHIDEDTVFELGGADINVVTLHGHTPGSVLFVDKVHRCVFVGDAVGSGCGVWMQVPGALSLSDYAASIRATVGKLTAMGVDDTWNFMGGHNQQRYTSTVSDDNPANLALMNDMAALCDSLISGETQPEPVPADNRAAMFGDVYFAKLGRAEMFFRKEQLV